MIRVVLDTNVIISATCVSNSLPGRLLSLWQNQVFEVVVSTHILHEFNDVIQRPKIRTRYEITDFDIAGYNRLLSIAAVDVLAEEIPDIVKEDPDDNHIIACAVKAGADYIVSGDRHLLQLREYNGIRIVTPAEFLMDQNLLD